MPNALESTTASWTTERRGLLPRHPVRHPCPVRQALVMRLLRPRQIASSIRTLEVHSRHNNRSHGPRSNQYSLRRNPTGHSQNPSRFNSPSPHSRHHSLHNLHSSQHRNLRKKHIHNSLSSPRLRHTHRHSHRKKHTSSLSSLRMVRRRRCAPFTMRGSGIPTGCGTRTTGTGTCTHWTSPG